MSDELSLNVSMKFEVFAKSSQDTKMIIVIQSSLNYKLDGKYKTEFDKTMLCCELCNDGK